MWSRKDRLWRRCRRRQESSWSGTLHGVRPTAHRSMFFPTKWPLAKVHRRVQSRRKCESRLPNLSPAFRQTDGDNWIRPHCDLCRNICRWCCPGFLGDSSSMCNSYPRIHPCSALELFPAPPCRSQLNYQAARRFRPSSTNPDREACLPGRAENLPPRRLAQEIKAISLFAVSSSRPPQNLQY